MEVGKDLAPGEVVGFVEGHCWAVRNENGYQSINTINRPNHRYTHAQMSFHPPMPLDEGIAVLGKFHDQARRSPRSNSCKLPGSGQVNLEVRLVAAGLFQTSAMRMQIVTEDR